MGMDSPVRGEAKVRARDTGGAVVQPNAHSACSRSRARWARQGTLSKGAAFRDVTPCSQQFPETNVIFQIQSSLWLLSSLSPPTAEGSGEQGLNSTGKLAGTIAMCNVPSWWGFPPYLFETMVST